MHQEQKIVVEISSPYCCYEPPLEQKGEVGWKSNSLGFVAYGRKSSSGIVRMIVVISLYTIHCVGCGKIYKFIMIANAV